MGTTSIKKTDRRQRVWRELMEVTGENTISGALDVAAEHMIQDVQCKQDVMEDPGLTPGQAEALSTDYLELEYEAEIDVTRP